MLRNLRRRLTAKGVSAAGFAAPWLPAGFVDFAERWLAVTGPTWPVLSRIVARNMRSAGVYSPPAFREYFAQVARHVTNAVRIFQHIRRPETPDRSGQGQAVAELAREQIGVDDTIRHIHEALQAGRGAIIAPPHVCNYLLTLARLNQEVPVLVYLRWSDDERKRELKQAWCEATGLRVILEPLGADPTSRAAACVEALRGGAVLVMTPDIAQKESKGVPVQLLGRRVYLPTGPASIAMLAEAPLVPVFGRLIAERPLTSDVKGKTAWCRCPHRQHRMRHVIRACEPVRVEPLPRSQGGRQEAVRRAMQAWTGGFEAFLRECPQAWFLWGDSRWTRVFRGDRRYSAESSE